MLVDIREPDEHARERMPGARNLPLSRLEASLALPAPRRSCSIAARAPARTGNAAAARRHGRLAEAYILEGGIHAWKKAGLPVAADRGQPIELMRQVQITAGSLVLLGVLLGVWVAPAFLALSGFVGAGLVFAGVSGSCGMAKLLGLMPWNRRGPARAAA